MGKAKVVNRLPQFVADVAVRGERGMTIALIEGAKEASVMTPIDTSNLLNSQFKAVRRVAGKITGTVGYTADYALPVHDPDVKQKFRRASAEKEFLRKGFEQAEPNIRAVLIGAIKV